VISLSTVTAGIVTVRRRMASAALPVRLTKIHILSYQVRRMLHEKIYYLHSGGPGVVLAAVLVGVLTYVRNHPVQERAFQPLVEIAAMEPDSSVWGVNFPNQYDTFMKTKTNNLDTTYAGSSAFSWLERDPRQVILFAGYAFSKDYNDDRGHANALEDVRDQTPQSGCEQSCPHPGHMLLL
jgi:hypothetical protein